MTCTIVFSAVCLLVIGCALPTQAQATTQCAYTFTSGNGNTYLSYCVTPNGNIPQIYTPFGHPQMGTNGEGYGICNESPATEYHDYGTGDSGNWNAATVLSHSGSSVKIARTTSDGNWTLTQTITKVPSSSSISANIKIVMALTNNQSTAHIAYLVRYTDVLADGSTSNSFGQTFDGAFAWSADAAFNLTPPWYGLQLQNVGTPQFGYLEGFAQFVPTGPSACAFAFNSLPYGIEVRFHGSLVMAYVTSVPAHGTKTATMTYRGL